MYPDVLSKQEGAFIETFESLPLNAQALLMRLIMRKHGCFRAAKICYAEIGDTATTAVCQGNSAKPGSAEEWPGRGRR
jgi:hypothetical protein